MDKNFNQQAKAIYSQSNTTPHTIDKELVESHKEDIFHFDANGRVKCLNREKYLKILEGVVNNKISKHQAFVSRVVQMLAPDGVWESLDVYRAHKFINEDYHYVYLRQWDEKNGEYINLNPMFLNDDLKGLCKTKLTQYIAFMPPQRHNPQLKGLSPCPELDKDNLIYAGGRWKTKEKFYTDMAREEKAYYNRRS